MALPRTPPDASTAFRLPKEMLETVDLLCRDFDVCRSQIFRRSLSAFIKSVQDQRGVQSPHNVPPTNAPERKWGPDLLQRMEQR